MTTSVKPTLGVQEYYDSIDSMTAEQMHSAIDELQKIMKHRTLFATELAVYVKLMENIQL